MARLLAAILVAVPLAVTPHLLFYFDVTPKITVLLLGTAAALIVGSCRWSGSRLWPVLLCAQGMWLAFSTTLSLHPELSLTGSNWRRFGFVTQAALLCFAYLLSTLVRSRPEAVRIIIRWVSAGGIVVAVYGIGQYFGIDPLLPNRGYHAGEGLFEIVRPPGTLGHAGYFATYLIYVLFVGVAAAIIDPSQGWRAAGCVAAAAAVTAIILSGTRGAVLGAAVGAVILILWLRPRVRIRSIAVMAVAAVAMLALYLSPQGQKLRSRTHWALEEPLGGARPAMWRDSIRMGARYWASGTGPETFSSEFPRFESASLARAFPDFYHESPHNVLLDAFTSQGVPGLIALVALSAWAFWCAWRSRIEHPRLSACAAAALAGALVSQQFVSFTLPTALYFFATVALLAGLEPGPRENPAPRRAPLMVAAACAAVFVFFAGRLLMADYYTARAQRQIQAGLGDRAIESYAAAVAWRLPGPSSDLWFSRVLADAAKQARDPASAFRLWSKAGEAAQRATTVSDEPQNAWYNLAAFSANANDFGSTERSLREAIRCAPNWFKPHWMLAQVLYAGGRTAEAAPEAKLAAELNGGKDPEVLRTLELVRSGGR
jgi:O-antigen ligase